jgi:hypothetical protein
VTTCTPTTWPLPVLNSSSSLQNNPEEEEEEEEEVKG